MNNRLVQEIEDVIENVTGEDKRTCLMNGECYDRN